MKISSLEEYGIRNKLGGNVIFVIPDPAWNVPFYMFQLGGNGKQIIALLDIPPTHPDMDYGPRDAVFVPFFGVPAATVTSLSRLAKISGAAVLPCTTQILPGGQGYVVRIEPPWENYPSDDVEADTRRMNAWLEERIRQMPEQYYWVHKRFKTRPEGAASLY